MPCWGPGACRTCCGPDRRSPSWGSTARPWSGSGAAITPTASARLNLRIPPGTDPDQADVALANHLRAAAPWGVSVECTTEFTGAPFRARTDGPAYRAMRAAMSRAYGRDPVLLGQGGSIPLCNVFEETYPDAEQVLMGVEEPPDLIHAPNESVDPTEIERLALVAEALFLQDYAGS